MKILIADDEKSVCDLLSIAMRELGHDSYVAHDGPHAISLFEETLPHLAILDVMMPFHDGFEVCESIRAIDPRIPVLFLSAKGDIADKRTGFHVGADDYLTKPFDVEELKLHVDALLRRASMNDDTVIVDGRMFQVGDFSFDGQRFCIMRNGREMQLTPKEYQILALLANNEGKIYSTNEMIELIWGKAYKGESMSVPVYIRRIRAKIEEDPSKPQHVRTAWGAGYFFEP